MSETDALPSPETPEKDDGPRFIRSLWLSNFLSFGSASERIEFRSLNVLVGANGSGKTNFVEGLAVLVASVTDISTPFRIGGGVQLYFNRLADISSLGIETIVSEDASFPWVKHTLVMGEEGQRLRIESESIYAVASLTRDPREPLVYRNDEGEVRIVGGLSGALLENSPSDWRQSLLSQVKHQRRKSEIGEIQRVYGSIRLYRSWTFGPDSVLRKPQAADLSNEWLAEDYGNLFLILNRMEFEPEAKAEYMERLRDFLPDVTDYKLQIIGGTILMFLMEGRNAVPATRLSDGTLRWLCLLAILVAPSPPGVIVLEEPELGLHPDMINTLAEMLKKAATRHQLVVTTHSDILIDALSDVPEAVMVVEKSEEGTTVRRLDAATLAPWLEEYRLGRLWMKGEIGGTRW